MNKDLLPLLFFASFTSLQSVERVFDPSKGVEALTGAIKARFWDGIEGCTRPDTVNLKTAQGETPLWVAAGVGCLKTVRFLLNAGAEVNIEGPDGTTAVHKACGSKKVMELLLKNGGDCTRLCGRGLTALHHAAEVGNREVLAFMLQSGVPIDVKDLEGRTPLWKAVSEKQLSIVKFLLGKEANPLERHGDESLLGVPTSPRIEEVLEAEIERRLKEKAVVNPELLKQEEGCPICLDAFDTEGVITECGHQFHTRCFDKLKKKECPLCRLKKPIVVDREDLHFTIGAAERKKRCKRKAKEAGLERACKTARQEAEEVEGSDGESDRDEWLPFGDDCDPKSDKSW